MKNLLIIIFAFVALISPNVIGQKLNDQSKEAIRVGVFVDLTGVTSSFGISTKNGIKLAVEEINKSGGIDGRLIELFIEDDQGRPETAKEAVRKLIEEKKVHAIIGEVASIITLTAAPEAQKAKIPMISPSSTNPLVTKIGDFIFRACFIDPHQGEAMAHFALFELRATKIATIGDVQSDYSKALVSNFEKTVWKYKGQIVSKQTYFQNDTDFTELLKKIKKSKPTAIYLAGYYSETAIIVKQARKMGVDVPILGADGWDSPRLWDLGGDSLKNTYITNHFSLENPAYLVRDFRNKFKERFESDADSLSALSYDTAYVLADALKRAKTTDGEKLRDSIAKTNYEGVTGKIMFDESRNPRKQVVILKLDPKSKSFNFYTIVNP